MKKSIIISWVLLGIALLMSCDNAEQAARSDGEVSGNVFQLDAVFGDDTNDCSAAAPCQTLARAQSVVQSGDVVRLAAGSYGEFNWELSGDFSDWITWQGIDATDRPVIDQVNLSCTQVNCDAYQRFDTVEIRLPAGPWQYMNVVSSFGNSYVEFIDSEMHPSNPILCATINAGQLPVDYIDQSLFVAPLYDYQHGENCGSGQPCDFTPAPGSPLCTMGSNGSSVGAFACDP
jgi:hypothetical protein